MTARDALAAARAAGIRLHVEATGLALEADAPPPPEVVHLLAEHKAAILSLLAAEAAEGAARHRAERVRTGMAGYPADDAERGEREAIAAEAELPERAGLTDICLAGLRRAALLRPPTIVGPAPPPDGAWCSACGGGQWWRPRGRATAWRCRGCYPVASLVGLMVAGALPEPPPCSLPVTIIERTPA